MRKSKMCSGGIEPGTEHAERRGVVKPFPANGLSFPLKKCPTWFLPRGNFYPLPCGTVGRALGTTLFVKIRSAQVRSHRG